MLHSEASIFSKTSKPLPRKSVVELPYVDTIVDAARLEARATHDPEDAEKAEVTASDGRGSKSVASVVNGFMEPRPSGVVMPEDGSH
jgi:hypothetical protein